MDRLMGEACAAFLTDAVDSLVREIAFEAHRDLRQGPSLAPCAVAHRRPSGLPPSSCRLRSAGTAPESSGADLFGRIACQAPTATATCAACGRSVAAARYAPHLEKCMGLGRSSSRIANQRLATYSSSSSSSEARVDVYGGSSRSLLEEDGGSDSEYKEPKTPRTPRKRGRPASPRVATPKAAASPAATQSSAATGASPPVAKKPKGRPRKHAPKELIEPLKAQSQAKIRAMLEETCGVVHPQSGKMCQGPLDCVEHSLSQQQHIRNALLGRKAGRLFREEQERRMGLH